jgi:hypothetical protein
MGAQGSPSSAAQCGQPPCGTDLAGSPPCDRCKSVGKDPATGRITSNPGQTWLVALDAADPIPDYGIHYPVTSRLPVPLVYRWKLAITEDPIR